MLKNFAKIQLKTDGQNEIQILSDFDHCAVGIDAYILLFKASISH